MDQLYYSIPDVAKMFGVGERTVKNWIYNKHFPVVRVSGRFYIPKRDIEEKTKPELYK